MTKNLNILVVTQNFYPETFGINDIVADMVEKNYKVDVLTGLPNYPQGKFYDGYSIFKRGPKYYKGAMLYRCVVFPRRKNSKLGISLNYASFPIFATLKLFLLIFKKYDKVIVYAPSPIFSCIPASIIAFLKRSEKIVYVLDIWPDSVYSVIDMKCKLLRKILLEYSSATYRGFDKLLITSKGFKEQLINYNIDEKKIFYLPQWVAQYEHDSTENELYEKYDDTFNIVFTGNVGIPQNLGILVRSALLLGHYNDIKYIIVGDGDYLTTFKQKVKENKIDDIFDFVGRKPYKDMPKYYEIADCLLCSLKNIELFHKIVPAKIQGYMAAGKPILSSIDGESGNIISNAKCGLVSFADDHEGLAKNIEKMYNMSNKERQLMGQNGIEYAKQHFNREDLLKRFEEIILE